MKKKTCTKSATINHHLNTKSNSFAIIHLKTIQNDTFFFFIYIYSCVKQLIIFTRPIYTNMFLTTTECLIHRSKYTQWFMESAVWQTVSYRIQHKMSKIRFITLSHTHFINFIFYDNDRHFFLIPCQKYHPPPPLKKYSNVNFIIIQTPCIKWPLSVLYYETSNSITLVQY